MVWYRSTKKQTTDDLLKLSVGWLKKHNCLQENTKINGEIYWKKHYEGIEPKNIASVSFLSSFIGENKYIELSYNYNQIENINYKIRIISSIPNYGGKRYWFVCPHCGKKVAFLYLRKNFLCRHCQNICYKTQQLGFADRMRVMSQKYQNKVMLNDTKKRWVHWKTFNDMMNKADDYENLSFISAYNMLWKMMNA